MNKVENDPLLSILYFPTAGRCIFNFFKKIPLGEKQKLSFVLLQYTIASTCKLLQHS